MLDPTPLLLNPITPDPVAHVDALFDVANETIGYRPLFSRLARPAQAAAGDTRSTLISSACCRARARS